MLTTTKKAALVFLLIFPLVGASATESKSLVDPCIPAWNQFSGSDRISSSIYTSIKGNDGLIYLGGRDGLYRVEGGKVHTWLPDFTDPNSLPSGRVKALANDGDYIWVGSNTGIARLNTRDGSFSRNKSINQAIGFSPVNAIELLNDQLYIATERGGYIVNRTRNIDELSIFQRFEDMGPLTDLAIQGNNVLATSDNGLWNLAGSTPPLKIALDGAELRAIIQGREAIWVISADTLYQQNNVTEEWTIHTRENLEGLPESDFMTLTQDAVGDLWIGAVNGLARWKLFQSHPIACRRNILGSDRDQDITIAHLSGKLGNFVFLGSNGRGAAFAPLTPDVRLVVPGGHYDSGLPANPIWSHFIDESGRFYAGTSSGLFVETAPKSNYFKAVAPDLLGKLRIYHITQLSGGRLWVGTSKGLFVRDDNGFSKLDLFLDEQQKPVSPSTFAIKEYQDSVLVATSAGLVVLNKKSLKVGSIFKTKEKFSAINRGTELLLPSKRIWSISISGDNVFIAGHDGAFKVDIESTTVLTSTVQQDDVSEPIGYLYNIAVADDNVVFLGTEAGLIETDFAFSYFRKITEINGRKLLSVMSSGMDSNGNTWIGVAGSGLFQFRPDRKTWTHLTQSKGLITNGVSQLGLSFTKDGQMAVSNATGASIVDLNSLELGNDMPANIRAFDASRNHLFKDGEEYQIGPGERDLTISFSVTELVEAGLYRIDYDLRTDSGFMRQASVPLNETLSFINLSPGKYNFNAKMTSSSGAKSSPVNFTVDVLPFWWETLLFKLFLILLFCTAVFAWFYYKTRAMEKRLEIVSDERKRIAQDLHDTSLQDIFGAKMLARTLLMEQTNDEDKSKVNRFIRLLETAINSLRSSVECLSKLTDVPDLPLAVSRLSQDICLPEGCVIESSGSGTVWPVKYQCRFFVYRIIREAVNNAAKHAEADCITVSLHWTPIYLNVEISDNGKGFDVSQSESGNTYGLKSMKLMAENARVKLQLTSAPGKGTQIELRLMRSLW